MQLQMIDPQAMTGEEVEELWSKVKDVEEAFDDRVRNRPDIFVGSFFAGTHYMRLDRYGVASASNVLVGGDANVHFTIWDQSCPFDAIRACKEALVEAFNRFELVRATTIIPEHNVRAIRACKLLGFDEEGKLRKANLFHGQWYDSIILGILRESVIPS